jgi:hypothetical protein
MALRRNPQRGCQERSLPSFTATKAQVTHSIVSAINNVRDDSTATIQHRPKPQTIRRLPKVPLRQIPQHATDKPFPFFSLPREIRDQVYSSLVVRPSNDHPTIAAAPILIDRKRRTASRAKRERANQKRLSNGRPPVRVRQAETEPIVHLNLLQASHQLYTEAKDYLYSNNWYAITLDRLALTTFETPYGWDLSRITRLEVELQLKDATHMNSYVDWAAFFASFTSLRFLRIIPTFHPRYHDWARPEFVAWTTTHFVHKAFFRELLATTPSHLDVKFGPSPDATSVAHLQGKAISSSLLMDMYTDLGPNRPRFDAIAVGRSTSWQ